MSRGSVLSLLAFSYMFASISITSCSIILPSVFLYGISHVLSILSILPLFHPLCGPSVLNFWLFTNCDWIFCGILLFWMDCGYLYYFFLVFNHNRYFLHVFFFLVFNKNNLVWGFPSSIYIFFTLLYFCESFSFLQFSSNFFFLFFVGVYIYYYHILWRRDWPLIVIVVPKHSPVLHNCHDCPDGGGPQHNFFNIFYP